MIADSDKRLGPTRERYKDAKPDGPLVPLLALLRREPDAANLWGVLTDALGDGSGTRLSTHGWLNLISWAAEHDRPALRSALTELDSLGHLNLRPAEEPLGRGPGNWDRFIDEALLPQVDAFYDEVEQSRRAVPLWRRALLGDY